MRKHTIFEPCDYHAAMYATESRYRRAETFVEGNWSLCPGEACRMKPGTDFYAADFVAAYPVYFCETVKAEPAPNQMPGQLAL